MRTVSEGLYVKVHYTGKLDNGEVFDSSQGCQPLEVQVGSGMLIKGFEQALLGMGVSDTKSFTLTPDEAYGARDETLEKEFPRSGLPKEFDPKVGELVSLRTEDNRQIPAKVKQSDEEKVVVDLNHPLAGETLSFDIEVVEINEEACQGSCGSCCGGCH